MSINYIDISYSTLMIIHDRIHEQCKKERNELNLKRKYNALEKNEYSERTWHIISNYLITHLI